MCFFVHRYVPYEGWLSKMFPLPRRDNTLVTLGAEQAPRGWKRRNGMHPARVPLGHGDTAPANATAHGGTLAGCDLFGHPPCPRVPRGTRG